MQVAKKWVSGDSLIQVTDLLLQKLSPVSWNVISLL